MAVRKCKMCGNSFDGQNASVVFCSFCGSKQTVPVIQNEQISVMYNKADDFRLRGEYEKAAGIYELIVNENPSDPEVYWSLVMCRYGISYVRDLSVDRYVIRVNRMSNIAVTDDGNYKKAIYYASEVQKKEYEREAGEILNIQKAYFAALRAKNANSASASKQRPVQQKTVPDPRTNNAPVNNTYSAPMSSAENMAKRMYMFLEDKDWRNADSYAERILDIDPENFHAYLGKMLAELKVGKKEELQNLSVPFDGRESFRKCMRFADSNMAAELTKYNELIRDRILSSKYSDATSRFKAAKTEEQFLEAAEAFRGISDYMDSAEKAEKCDYCAEMCRKDTAYFNAAELMKKGTLSDIGEALKILRTIEDWKNAPDLIADCEMRLGDAIEKDETEKAVHKKTMKVVRNMILSGAAVSGVAAVISVIIYILVWM